MSEFGSNTGPPPIFIGFLVFFCVLVVLIIIISCYRQGQYDKDWREMQANMVRNANKYPPSSPAYPPAYPPTPNPGHDSTSIAIPIPTDEPSSSSTNKGIPYPPPHPVAASGSSSGGNDDVGFKRRSLTPQELELEDLRRTARLQADLLATQQELINRLVPRPPSPSH